MVHNVTQNRLNTKALEEYLRLPIDITRQRLAIRMAVNHDDITEYDMCTPRVYTIYWKVKYIY